ncbi:thylakoid lumenal 15.0 kDa protein 2, chloroplastic isoform X3 [Cryptomeria japonica]|uniref:thylakoid lumenal 15.0 kDa protein 2, chloroplastic isoform X3 n=1 Tax=Cryptomeria japonica TaxID=3369 RepID=UPI0027DA8CDA|nr:thylakoid lumenal 15.0 kDa protein 2, chloroplastic isoform X3 [Cryptomeria japonica]
MGLQAIHLTAVSPLVVSPPSKNFKQAKGWAMPSSTLFLQNPGKQKYNIAIRAKLSNGMANWVQVNRSVLANAVVVGALSLSISICGLGKATAKEGVNKPEMLPKEFTPLIDVAGYLSPSQESRMIEAIYNLEKDTGFKLRVLAQNYPETPGLAVRDFWQVDDNTIVFVADPTFGRGCIHRSCSFSNQQLLEGTSRSKCLL